MSLVTRLAGNQILTLRISTGVIALATATLLFRPDMRMSDRPVQEDGFYSLTVAHNIALGNGPTIDGSTLTNGFQPLFTYLSVPAFIIAGENKYAAIRYVLMLHWIFLLTTAYLLGLIAYDAWGKQLSPWRSPVFWWVGFIYISSVLVFFFNFNGLETGFLLFSYAIAWRYYQVKGIEKLGNLLTFGVILGMLVLVRIDAALLVAAVSLYQVLSRRERSLGVRVGRCLAVACISLLVSSPWWLYNLHYFGSFMPTSGRAYQQWILSSGRVEEAAVAVLRTMMPIIYLGQNTFESVVVSALRTILILAAVASLWRIRRKVFALSVDKSGASLITKRTLEFGTLLLVFLGGLILSYTLTFSGSWYYTRYFSPMVLLSTLGIGLLVEDMSQRIRSASTIFAMGMTIPMLTVILILHSRLSQNTFVTEGLKLINDYAPRESYVASFQTGTLGYFRDRVVNLDGKVNVKAIEYRSNLQQYLRENRIEWLCDWQWSLEAFLGKEANENGWRVVGTKGSFALYHKSYSSTRVPAQGKRTLCEQISLRILE